MRAIILLHPVAGMLVFREEDYALACNTAVDIGDMYDLNEIGTPKSRCTLVWTC